jgi:hypothetical protein
MALTTAQIRQRLRGMFADAEDSVNRPVQELVNTLQGQLVVFKNDGNQLTATTFVPLGVFTAINKCRLVSARYMQSISSTVSLTDRYIFSVIKYKSPTWSATYLMAYLKGTTDAVTGKLTVNKPRASNLMTLTSLSSEFEMNAGDVLRITVVKDTSGPAGIGQALPNGVLVLEIG